MNEQGKKVPTLRFKGFTNDWEQRKLGDIVENYDSKRIPIKEKDRKHGKYPYYGATGIIDYIDQYIFDGEYLLLAEDGANIVDRTSPITYITEGKFWLNNHAHIMNSDQVDLLFLKASLDKLKYDKFNTGTAQPKLNAKVVSHIKLNIPSRTEQNRIARMLNNLEKLITLQQRKLDLLKQLKKGLLQKMFAEKNSKQPALRFKGFHDDWEQRKLGELYSYHNGKAHEQNQRSSGKYELINLNSISVDGTLKSSGRYINHADEILRQNDLVMILSDIAHGTLLGRVAIIPQDNKYVLNQRVALLRPISKSENSNFMAPLINNNQRYFHKMGIGTSQLNISKSTVIESLWQIPKIKEQSVIGNFLQNIDHIIALQHQKLAKYQSVKKSLLQQMFI